MKLIILSAGRPDYQLTLQSLPEHLHKHVEVWVPKAELGAYQSSDQFEYVRDIRAWPRYIDCVPRKRAYAMENFQNAMLLDDDLTFSAWDKDSQKLVGTDTKLGRALIEQHLTDTLPRLRERHAYIGLGSRFMCQQKIGKNSKTLTVKGEIPVCAVSRTQLAKQVRLKYTTFFFTDVSIPMQVKQAGLPVATFYGLIYSLRANQKLAATGTTPYRSDAVVKYSATSMAKMFPGFVFGLKQSGKSGGGWTLLKKMSDLDRKPSQDRKEKTYSWAREFAKEEGLKRFPPLVNIMSDTTREELYKEYARNWKAAQK